MYVCNASFWISTLSSNYISHYLPFLFYLLLLFFYWNEHLAHWLQTLIYLYVYLFLPALHCWTKKHSFVSKNCSNNFCFSLLPTRFWYYLACKIALTRWWRMHGATRGENNRILICVATHYFAVYLSFWVFKFHVFLLMHDSATKYVPLCCILCWGSSTTDFGTLRVAFIGSFPLIYYLTLLNRF